MSGDLITVGKYRYEYEAEIARATLQAEGIDAVVLADNAGAMLPSIQMLFPLRLAVGEADAEAARHVLATREPLSESEIEELGDGDAEP